MFTLLLIIRQASFPKEWCLVFLPVHGERLDSILRFIIFLSRFIACIRWLSSWWRAWVGFRWCWVFWQDFWEAYRWSGFLNLWSSIRKQEENYPLQLSSPKPEYYSLQKVSSDYTFHTKYSQTPKYQTYMNKAYDYTVKATYSKAYRCLFGPNPLRDLRLCWYRNLRAWYCLSRWKCLEISSLDAGFFSHACKR